MIYDDLNIIFPEIFLSVYAMVALLGVVYTSKDELAKRVTWVTAFIFILVAFLIIFSEEKQKLHLEACSSMMRFLDFQK